MPLAIYAHHNAGVELVKSLHSTVTETVAQILLHEIGVVEDVIGNKRLLQS